MRKNLMNMMLVAFICLALVGCGGAGDASGKADASTVSAIEAFSTVDMDGNVVNEEVFVDYDLTVINIWATWCGYCVDEMPGLEAFYQDLPDNVNFFTICIDAEEEPEVAKKILAESNATFQTLVSSESLHASLLQYIQGYPATVFVDNTGRIVGDVQLGAPRGDVAKGYMDLVEERLSLSVETESIKKVGGNE